MRFPWLPVCASLLAPLASASQTTSSLTLGGTGSYGSDGSFDPGTLSDGVTVASGSVQFDFDDVAGTLVLTVSNTSPVLPGVCNPVITDIYFNTPVQVTGLSLTNASAASGATPAQSLTFDANLGANPNPNGANGFGAFNAALEQGSIAGAIANPAATTLPGPPGSLAIGPAVFTFSVSGVLAGLTASDFSGAFSVNPPGSMPSNGCLKFQGGGPSCDASGFISGGGGGPEQCLAILGSSSIGGTFNSPFPGGYPFETQLQPRVYRGVSMESPVVIQLPPLGSGQRVRAFDGSPGPLFATRMFVQVVMWNPDVFPANPEQSSNGIEVVIWSDGTFSATPYGANDGMNLAAEVLDLPDGRRYLKLPFTIDGP